MTCCVRQSETVKRIAVIGSGYVGLVSGAMFAAVGNRVVCVDKDPSIVSSLTQGKCTIHEPGLEEILRSAISEENLSFTANTAEAVLASEATFIAVGTPSMESGAYDFRYVYAAAQEIGRALRTKRDYHIVVLKSTVTPDIYTAVKDILHQETEGSGVQFEVVSNPEFLAEGTAVRDFSQPSRVVVGAVSQAAREFMEALYAPYTRRTPGLLQFTDPKSAIVTKLAANTFLACRVALINEIAQYCDAVGADIDQVRTGLASDPRIGRFFLYAGPGYGGSCFGKDLRALRESAREHAAEVSLIPAIEDSNNRHKMYLVRAIERHLAPLSDKTVAVWGIAFKARTDDIRESPALAVIDALLERGVKVQAHDPQAHSRAADRYGDRVTICGNKYETLNGAHALVIMTEWDTYKSPDLHELRDRLLAGTVVDGRNILDPDEVENAGLTYVGMGRRGGRTKAAAALNS
jgi:UDPglucose 6-dehydrogenase